MARKPQVQEVIEENPDAMLLAGGPLDPEPAAPVSEPAEQPPAPAAEPPPWKTELDSFRSEVAALRRENAQLRQAIPPTVAAQPPQPEEPDWDKLFFDSPKQALDMFGDRIVRKIKTELTAQYQRDQGAQGFWRDFYVKHPDLREDHDLVQSTLESNFADISPLSIPQALERLALLTRERIVRYSGKAKVPVKRPTVEGGGTPAPTRILNEGPRPSTLSDLIRGRRKLHGAV